MKKIHNLKRLEKFRKKLRESLTPAEAVLIFCVLCGSFALFA